MKISKGSIFKRKQSQFLHINLSVNSKRYIFPTNLSDKKEVEKKLILLKAGLLNGSITLEKEEDKQIITFKHYSEIFISTKVLKPSTITQYQHMINRWNRHFRKRDINTIKPSEIKSVLYNFNVGSAKAKQYLSMARGIFNEAILDNVIPTNPCDKIKPPRDISKKDIFPFEQDEVVTILEKSNGWFKNFLATAFYTGARSGELYALKWQNVDFTKKRIYIDASRGDYEEGTTKTGKGRYLPIFDSLVSYLKAQKMVTGMKTYVFLTEYNKNLTPSNVRTYHWIPLLKRIKIPYRKIYSTRHTFATTLLNSGKFSLNQIASLLGHTNIQMLIRHYNKFIEDENTKIDTSINPFCDSFCSRDVRSA